MYLKLALPVCAAGLSLILNSCSISEADSFKLEITDARAQSAYWLKPDPRLDEILATQAELSELNARLIADSGGTMMDLSRPPEALSRQALIGIFEDSLVGYDPENLQVYADYKPLNKADFLNALQNCNMAALGERILPQHALIIRQTSLRGLPQSQGWYAEPGEFNYDNLQIKVLDPAEPVWVLHTSRDQQYYLVQTNQTTGWVKVKDVVLVSASTFKSYVKPQQFVVLLKPKQYLSSPAAQLKLQMGAKLPVLRIIDDDHYAVKLPLAGREQYEEQEIIVTSKQGFRLGYLPLTRRNLVQQAFAYLGTEYGWGGQNNGIDCSGLICNVYRTAGVFLPNNTRAMLTNFPQLISMPQTDSLEQRLDFLQGMAEPGDCLIKSGHVVMYLGTDAQGEPLGLHALSSFYPDQDLASKHYIRKVIVSSLWFKNKHAQPFIANTEAIGKPR
ncbi:MAG: SH3 domain-containing protein [Succinivibrio sp.]|nr:SH3 domain-containing protein [Succinivibrio sp.]